MFILDEGQKSYDDDDSWPIIESQDIRSVGPHFGILTCKWSYWIDGSSVTDESYPLPQLYFLEPGC